MTQSWTPFTSVHHFTLTLILLQDVSAWVHCFMHIRYDMKKAFLDIKHPRNRISPHVQSGGNSLMVLRIEKISAQYICFTLSIVITVPFLCVLNLHVSLVEHGENKQDGNCSIFCLLITLILQQDNHAWSARFYCRYFTSSLEFCPFKWNQRTEAQISLS